MATIPTPGSELRHVRKTLVFDGSSGKGLLNEGRVSLISCTGRVEIQRALFYVSDPLVCADVSNTLFTLQLGTAGFGPYFVNAALVDDFDDAGGFIQNQGGNTGEVFPGVAPVVMTIDNSFDFVATSEGIYISVYNDPGAGDNITGGTLEIDIWYRPITDDGALAGDDIDEDSRTWMWAQALADIASVPAITASAKDALNWLFALARNKRTQTATTETVYKDDGSTSLATSTKSDDGTTFTRGKYS